MTVRRRAIGTGHGGENDGDDHRSVRKRDGRVESIGEPPHGEWNHRPGQSARLASRLGSSSRCRRSCASRLVS